MKGGLQIMYKTYKFRLYPNKEQEILLSKTFGCVRFVYNHYLDKCKKNNYNNAFSLAKDIPNLSCEYEFLNEVDSCALRNSVFNLDNAYKNFFEKRNNYPVFKNKFSRQSYRTNCIRGSYKGKKYSNIKVDLENKTIKLPKFPPMKIRGYRNLKNLEGKIINATVIKEKYGKYYVSVVVEEPDILTAKKVVPRSIVGMDLGVKDLVITSNGEKYGNPKVIQKYEKKIKYLQRELSRRKPGGNNYVKTKRKLARVYSKIANARKHNIINIVNDLVRDNDIIVSEKLNVKGMSQNHNLAKNVLDASFNKICMMLKWKCELLGKYYYQVSTFFPSSKTCSMCGMKTDKTNDLGVREWVCDSCGSRHDRDINASINIMFEGLKLHYTNCYN